MALQKNIDELDNLVLKGSKIMENYENIKLETGEPKLRAFLSKLFYEMESKIMSMAQETGLPQNVLMQKRLDENWDKKKNG